MDARLVAWCATRWCPLCFLRSGFADPSLSRNDALSQLARPACWWVNAIAVTVRSLLQWGPDSGVIVSPVKLTRPSDLMAQNLRFGVLTGRGDGSWTNVITREAPPTAFGAPQRT